MNDDPSVKELLSTVASLPKKVGATVLNAKVPVNGFKGSVRFVLRHWLAAVLSFAVLCSVSFHYVSEISTSRYSCYGSRANFTLPRDPQPGMLINAAIAISPVSQVFASWNLESRARTYDLDWDYRKFLVDNELGIEYGPIVAAAGSSEHATRLVKYERSQVFAKCLANESWLTFLVIFAHALMAYLPLLMMIPVRHKLTDL